MVLTALACLRRYSVITLGSGLVASAAARSFASDTRPTAHAAIASPGPTGELRSLEQRVSALEELHRKRPVVVCGPSGVGKGTLLGRLLKDYPDQFGFSVSHTTRAPRKGEENGVHYYFVDISEMEAMIARGEFLEYARVHNKIYGTSIAGVRAVADTGKTCLLDIDVQGAALVKKTNLNARFIFISPPALNVLEARLRGRGTESEKEIAVRLENAQKEMASLEISGFYDAVIVNDDLEVAYARLKQILLVPES
jgi:guanylate kinase